MTRDELFAPPPWGSVRLAWVAGGLGVALGFVDFWLLAQLGITARLGVRDVTWGVSAYFALSFGVLAFLLGYAREARQRLRQQAGLLQAQYEALQRSQRRAAENEKLAAIGRLAACVAHEVRNPLGVIRPSASMMMEDLPLEDDRWRAGEFICEEVIRLDAFCKALLNFSRPVALAKKPVALSDVLGAVERRVAASWEGEGEAPFAVELPPSSWVVEADMELLLQACLGLSENAMQAVGAGGRVVMRARQLDQGSLCVEIADDGPGIGDELERKIFEPFFTTKAHGTGLGLAMSGRIIEAHGGQLALVPQGGLGPDGQGACFRLTLPTPGEGAP